jgi:Flp pilus assembly pilin Flp
MSRSAVFLELSRRFILENKGGAATEYVMFAACWGLAVSAGLYFTTNVLTAKFDAVATALKGVNSSLR